MSIADKILESMSSRVGYNIEAIANMTHKSKNSIRPVLAALVRGGLLQEETSEQFKKTKFYASTQIKLL